MANLKTRATPTGECYKRISGWPQNRRLWQPICCLEQTVYSLNGNFNVMKLSARLVLLLTFSVGIVTAAATLITLHQRERTLRDAAREEVRIHALTLRIALEEDYLTGRTLDAQRLINRLRENVGVYSVVLFDAEAKIVGISNTFAPEEFRYLNEARQVIAGSAPIGIARSIGGEDYYSLVMPLKVEGRCVGAIEIVQSISFAKNHITKARLDIATTAVLVFFMISLVVTLVTRYNLAQPIQELLDGVMAIGRGDLNHKVILNPRAGELARLGQEFNRMAGSLAEQRVAAAREAEERVALERRLRHSEQLAAVGSLAAGVAHEMGAPLQVIDGRAKQLLNNPNAPLETRQRNLTIIRHQAARITRIVRQLLDLARPYNLRLQDVQLSALIREAVELIEPQAESGGVQIETMFDSNAKVEADRELVHQVLLNICQNAIQAMPQGGRLQIECISNAKTKDGQQFAALRVSDTGTGIAPEHLEQIFVPFFTTKEVGQGTGLGLPVSRHIIEEHGGWIEAANRAERGAIFTVYLPQAAVSSEQEIGAGTIA